MLEIVAGYDAREVLGYQLFTFSAHRRTSRPLRFVPLMERALRYQGLYTRPHEQRDGKLWCPISDAPMATEFAISRFLTPWLVEGSQWALFADGADMLFQDDPAALFALADDRFAVQVVKREYVPAETVKMDGQTQTSYPRKNWSSLILWNLDHPANSRLTQEMVNELPGRDLHGFFWLRDNEIGELPGEWNHLVGIDPDRDDAKLLHFTLGSPELGIESSYAPGWRREIEIMEAATRMQLRA
jgi:hypothetical protein